MKPIRLAFTAVLLFSVATGACAQASGKWVGAWGFPSLTLGTGPLPTLSTPAPVPGAAPTAPPPTSAPLNLPVYDKVTVRHVMKLTTGGDEIRLRLSNEHGAAAMTIGEARVGLVGPDGAIMPGTDRAVTFNGGVTSVAIPPFAPMISDPIALKVPARQSIAVSVFLPEPTRPPSHRPQLFVAPGNQTGAATLTDAQAGRSGAILSQIEVKSKTVRSVIVALGDSITEGGAASPLVYRSWPDALAERIAKSPYAGKISIVNAGVSGGRLLREGSGPAALARFDRDISSVSGATHVVLLEAINDIGNGFRRPAENPTTEELIGAYKQLILRAHAKGLKIYGATLTPYEGAGYYDAAGEAKRQALNAFIRTPGNFDGFIDFEKAVRDPAAPTKWAAGVQTGDNLHPNAAGYEAMAAAVDLKMFGVK